MEILTQFNSYVKMEAEAIDNYCDSSSSSSDSCAGSNSAIDAAEDVQQLALEQATHDMNLACASLKISPDPLNWNADDVRRWLLWTINHYNLPEASVKVNLFDVNGLTLCSWNEYEFIVRSVECGEILNTLLDVWKSTGKLRRSINNAAVAPQQQQQQQPPVVKYEAASYPSQTFGQQQQQQFNYQYNNNNAATAMFSMPSPPPYATALLQQQQQQQMMRSSPTKALFFNASAAGGCTPPSPPMHQHQMLGSPPQQQQQHYGGGLISKQQDMYAHHHQQRNMMSASSNYQSQLFMSNILPTPSPSNSTGNYNSDDCESLESYDMNIISAASVTGASGPANYISSPSVVNTTSSSNIITPCSIVSSSTNSVATPLAAPILYDKYYGNPPGQANIHLWQFLKELLSKPELHTSCIRWVDRTKGVFKIEDSVRVARLWGKRKNRPAMNYDKLSRSIRQYYKKGIMKKTEKSQRLVYQFCHPYCC